MPTPGAVAELSFVAESRSIVRRRGRSLYPPLRVSMIVLAAAISGCAVDDPAELVITTDPLAITPGTESVPCFSHEVGNDRLLEFASAALRRDLTWHHSTWFVVDADAYPGTDGYWECDSRKFFPDASDAVRLFEQTTTTIDRVAPLALPAHAKIVAVLHLVNLSDVELTAHATLTLSTTPPRS